MLHLSLRLPLQYHFKFRPRLLPSHSRRVLQITRGCQWRNRRSEVTAADSDLERRSRSGGEKRTGEESLAAGVSSSISLNGCQNTQTPSWTADDKKAGLTAGSGCSSKAYRRGLGPNVKKLLEFWLFFSAFWKTDLYYCQNSEDCHNLNKPSFIYSSQKMQKYWQNIIRIHGTAGRYFTGVFPRSTTLYFHSTMF